MSSRFIIALDVDTLKEAERLLKLLSKKVKIFKIGPHLFTRYGQEALKLVKKFKCDVFLDLKLHDIPNTVAGTIRQMARLKVFMLTIHTQGGFKMMKEAVLALKDEARKKNTRKPIILGVTVLSSFDEKTLASLNIKKKLNEQVVSLGRLAKKAGLDGLIVSPKEISIVRKSCGKDLILVSPGIRPKGASKGDQVRVMTPKEAVREGADYIVIGRPVIKSREPLRVVNSILKEIGEA